MVASLLVLIYFFILLYLVFWNLNALSHVPPLSFEAVGLVFIFAFMVVLLTIVTLFALIIILLRRTVDC